MRQAIKDLCQLNDERLFSEVADGLSYVVEHVENLNNAALNLNKEKYFDPAKILGALADEEAAKALILLDAIRCPREKSQERSRTFGHFNDHLAKGIYAEACRWKPVYFSNICRPMESQRDQFFWDGPNGNDFITANPIKYARIERLYVDYWCIEENMGQTRSWQKPGEWFPEDIKELLRYRTSPIVSLIFALHNAGIFASEGLDVVAKIWRKFEPCQDTHIDDLMRLNRETIENMKRYRVAGDADANVIYNGWTFPLWPLDLSEKKVNLNQLR